MQSQSPSLEDRPVASFFFDLAIAVAALFALSAVAGTAWAIFEIIRSVLVDGAIPKPDGLIRVIGQPDALAMIWITLVSTGGAALLVYFWRRRASTAERAASAQAARRLGTWGWAMATAAGAFLFSSAITSLAQYFGTHPEPTNLALIEEAFTTSPVFLAVFGVLLAPAYEEVLFRRVLFGRLWAAGHPLLGVALSSAAFAFMHEIPGTTGNTWQATGLLWLTYGVMGAAFAGLYWRTRTLWAPIAAHALNNAVALVVLKLYGAG
ncbi:MAG TPA: CPBP family intramembrane glutamic endopeptidase [Pseudoxanthomonas sp.]